MAKLGIISFDNDELINDLKFECFWCFEKAVIVMISDEVMASLLLSLDYTEIIKTACFAQKNNDIGHLALVNSGLGDTTWLVGCGKTEILEKLHEHQQIYQI